MNEHDQIRLSRAESHQSKKEKGEFASQQEELESLKDALVGLQSTDAPELVPLHDILMSEYRQLQSQLDRRQSDRDPPPPVIDRNLITPEFGDDRDIGFMDNGLPITTEPRGARNLDFDKDIHEAGQ